MQKIIVFQQNNSGKNKIAGIKRFGQDRFLIEIKEIDDSLPGIIDDASDYLPDHLEADLVLDFLKHPDLSTDLAILCEKEGVPVVASGKKITQGKAITPPT